MQISNTTLKLTGVNSLNNFDEFLAWVGSRNSILNIPGLWIIYFDIGIPNKKSLN